MKETLKKQHYKFTIYHLETYYSSERKSVKYWDNNSVYFEKKTWVNHSNYKEVFSLHFSDEKKLKIFLRERYKSDYRITFCTTLGYAIKSSNLDNAREWMSIISTATSQDSIGFQLRERKKKNRFPEKKHSNYRDAYARSYDWLAKEIKRKKINEFNNAVNCLDY